MLAVITREGIATETPRIPIAGRPLLLRQLQWLRGCGFDEVAIDLPASYEGRELEGMLRDDPLGWDVRCVQTEAPLSPRDLAAAAGFPVDVPIVALPGDVLGGGDLSQIYKLAATLLESEVTTDRGDMTLHFAPPLTSWQPLQSAQIRLIGGCLGADQVVDGHGWGVRITCADDAIALGAAALDVHGEPAENSPAAWLLLHAAEHAPGIWVARGGHIDEGAEVIAPALVGAGAVVRSGAKIGPRVFLGDRSVVERGTALSDALVAPDTIVGEGITATRAVLSPRGLQSTGHDATFLAVDDPLLLARRRGQTSQKSSLHLISMLLMSFAVAAGITALL